MVCGGGPGRQRASTNSTTGSTHSGSGRYRKPWRRPGLEQSSRTLSVARERASSLHGVAGLARLVALLADREDAAGWPLAVLAEQLRNGLRHAGAEHAEADGRVLQPERRAERDRRAHRAADDGDAARRDAGREERPDLVDDLRGRLVERRGLRPDAVGHGEAALPERLRRSGRARSSRTPDASAARSAAPARCGRAGR